MLARAGFQTQQHFTEVFHRYTGVTPRAYRLYERVPFCNSFRLFRLTGWVAALYGLS
ncbi:AraC family transcriptional regulator [Paraburkholderia kirstenboschensis]|uniref:AraC family transcriptional regulator n=1 Tax=Paraburkholderia kirstenboschensis TaxID=1245436 RepID=A0ABZ0EE06_9BURK|nr:AraC family transcriptional regulator [Paraburkholderia kirstenboschensis]WOD14744.1 AraC family transcriptional regulator [Paraburkholderia kirstenboschensis]